MRRVREWAGELGGASCDGCRVRSIAIGCNQNCTPSSRLQKSVFEAMIHRVA